MSEQKMIEIAQEALGDHGIEDPLLAVGQFTPRGTSGASFAGGMIGGGAGDIAGDLAGGVGLGAGMVAAGRAHAEASGLPQFMLVGVSDSTVYGMPGRSRSKKPEGILFAVPREGLTVKVNQRVNVRVLELIQDETGAKIELEGNRIPLTHSKDVLDVLSRMPEEGGGDT